MAQVLCPVCGGVRGGSYDSCYKCNGTGVIDDGNDSSSSKSSSDSSSSSSSSSTFYNTHSEFSSRLASGQWGRSGLDQDIDKYINEGIILSEKGDHIGSIEACTRAVHIAHSRDISQERKALAVRGRSYTLIGDYDNAIADLTNSLISEEGAVRCKRLINLAQAYRAKGLYNEATTNCNECIKIGYLQDIANKILQNMRTSPEEKARGEAFKSGATPKPKTLVTLTKKRCPSGFSGNGEYRYMNHLYSIDCVYNGRWDNGEPDGMGKATWDNGQVFEGLFRYGSFREGKLTYSDGSVYEGEFSHCRREGEGKMTYPDGRIEEGKWKDDKFKGKGFLGGLFGKK